MRRDKVVFLDFDGVIVAPNRGNGIQEDLVELVNGIALPTRARIVISSAWRHWENLAALRKRLVRAGLRAEVIDLTPDFTTTNGVRRRDPWKTRGLEIGAWLMGRRLESYVVLDDAPRTEPIPADRWVQTSQWNGIQPDDVKRAIAVLGAKQ